MNAFFYLYPQKQIMMYYITVITHKIDLVQVTVQVTLQVAWRALPFGRSRDGRFAEIQEQDCTRTGLLTDLMWLNIMHAVGSSLQRHETLPEVNSLILTKTLPEALLSSLLTVRR